MARKKNQGADPVKQWTIVFDFGGVLSEGHDPVSAIHREVGGSAEPVGHAYWEQRPELDAGVISGAHYWTRVCEAAGISDPSAEEIQALQDADNRYWCTLAKGSRGLLHDLARNGVRLVLLSNAPAELGEYVRKQEWFEAFAFAVISAEEKVAKPDREIYEIVLDSVAHDTGGVSRPSKVLFFDDREDNVDAAKALGIDAHLWPRNGEGGAPGWEIARELIAERGIPLG